jgi:hypothetical protein
MNFINKEFSMSEEKLCESCNKEKATIETFDPVSMLMGQEVTWHYCGPCHKIQFDYVDMIRDKFKDDPKALKDFLLSIG